MKPTSSDSSEYSCMFRNEDAPGGFAYLPKLTDATIDKEYLQFGAYTMECEQKKDKLHCSLVYNSDKYKIDSIPVQQMNDQHVSVHVHTPTGEHEIYDIAWLSSDQLLPSIDNIFSDVDTWKTTWGSSPNKQ